MSTVQSTNFILPHKVPCKDSRSFLNLTSPVCLCPCRLGRLAHGYIPYSSVISYYISCRIFWRFGGFQMLCYLCACGWTQWPPQVPSNAKYSMILSETLLPFPSGWIFLHSPVYELPTILCGLHPAFSWQLSSYKDNMCFYPVWNSSLCGVCVQQRKTSQLKCCFFVFNYILVSFPGFSLLHTYTCASGGRIQ